MSRRLHLPASSKRGWKADFGLHPGHETKDTNFSLSDWKVLCPKWHQIKKQIGIALSLCLRQRCCLRGMVTELDNSQEGIWGQSRCFFYNLKACHILAFLFLPAFLVMLCLFYLLRPLQYCQVWADVMFWLFLYLRRLLTFCYSVVFSATTVVKNNNYNKKVTNITKKLQIFWRCFSSHR